MNEKLTELLKDQAFVEKLIAQETDTDVKALLAENGVDLSLQEIAKIKQGIESQIEGNAELSDDDLENVAGGSDISDIIEAAFNGIGALGDKVHTWTRRRW